MTTLQQLVRRSVGIMDDDGFVGDWRGVSGSSYELIYNIDRGGRESNHRRSVYFGFIGCEYCGTRNPNDNKTFYCVACGGPLPS